MEKGWLFQTICLDQRRRKVCENVVANFMIWYSFLAECEEAAGKCDVRSLCKQQEKEGQGAQWAVWGENRFGDTQLLFQELSVSYGQQLSFKMTLVQSHGSETAGNEAQTEHTELRRNVPHVLTGVECNKWFPTAEAGLRSGSNLISYTNNEMRNFFQTDKDTYSNALIFYIKSGDMIYDIINKKLHRQRQTAKVTSPGPDTAAQSSCFSL